MTTRRLLSVGALLTTAALIVAGCGSSESEQPSAADARAAYQSIRTEIAGLASSIGDEITNAPNETDVQLTSAFGRLNARGQAAVARLRDLELPDSLDDERQALRDALDAGTQDLADIADAARDSDGAAAASAVRQLIADSRTIADARDDFEHALEQARD